MTTKTGTITGLEYPKDEVQAVNCRGGSSCQGRRAKVLLKKDEGFAGRLIQYQCLECKRTFSIRF